MDTVERSEKEVLQGSLRGSVLLPQDADYEQARKIWNAMIDKRPAMIVRCAGAADVRTAVDFARERGLPLAVRGGGHNIAGSALVNDGLVIDLSGMRSVQVAPHKQRAWVEGGALLRDVDHETQAYGLATPLGINSTTGVGGLTLGGGFGWLTRKHGMAVDNLVSADIVTAGGERLHIDRDHHPDLFWAIRGGGGNFGVVTTFEFALHQVGPLVTAGLIVFPFAEARSLLRSYRDYVEALDDNISVWAVLRGAPPLPFLPESVHGTGIVALAFFSPQPVDQVQDALATVRGFGTPIGEHVGAVPYAAWQQAFDPLLVPPARNYWKSHNFNTLSDAAIDVVVDYAGRLPSTQSEIFLGLIGGAANTRPPDETAYPHRKALYAMNVHTRWDTPSEDASCLAWAREFFKAAAPHAAGGVYINFLNEDEVDRIAEAYGPNYARLRQVKAQYDPQNLFRANQNILPA
ncbi:FAD-binding oxidoreductase [Massilia sp. Mn16-1_5]|uniref:FAD-binding oxidoreductase n=1 Tax=Massilia sp. Mn16-1_5 TaxID=2079199 RepID=UPI00109E71CE|nr:FAD-binding oxidoreductase [Massilia sp. Mn16-1_5]THC41692.1 FAD-linked oxidase [Massilia sp. Mn16-1_5]